MTFQVTDSGTAGGITEANRIAHENCEKLAKLECENPTYVGVVSIVHETVTGPAAPHVPPAPPVRLEKVTRTETWKC